MQEFHDIRPPVPVGLDPMTVKIFLILFTEEFRICWLTGDKSHPSSTTPTSNRP